MVEIIQTRYSCDVCNRTRSLHFKRENRSHQIFSPENNPNGLIVYSDIHRCANGILGINNLYIDNDSNVRSTEHLKLPSEKKRQNSLKGLPSPTISNKKFQDIRITGVHDQANYRITLLDKELGINLIIGDVKPNKEEEQATINSRNDIVILNFYKSNIQLDDNLENWLKKLVDLLEELPATKIGLFVDTLRYLHKLRKVPPAKFHINMLKTILISHKIKFSLKEADVDHRKVIKNNSDLYGNDAVDLMIQIIDFLKVSPNATLQQFTLTHHEDISHLVYMFHLLEQDGLIDINQPDGSRH